MAWLGRYFLPDQPLHVIQRRNNRQPIFFAEQDWARLHDWLAEAADDHGCAIHAYVLMTNRLHLLATPREAASVPRTMQSLGRNRAERQAAYRALFRQPLDGEIVAALRTATNGGWVPGDERFRNAIAAALGRRVAPLPPGRPRRKREDH